MQKLTENKIRISVRNLVEFILRSGDIDNRRGGAKEKDAMLAGAKIHRKIQAAMGVDYRAEVVMKREYPVEDILVCLEGRADGIITKGEQITIDEIKGVYFDVARLEEPLELHMAQAKCYAYMKAEEEGLKEIGVQMTYCRIETEEIRRFYRQYGFEELKQWFDKLLASFGRWGMYLYEQRRKRNDSIRPLQFPFPYRRGQRDLTIYVYRTITRGKTMFAQAPTGIGKTLSTLFPAVKAVGEGYGDKIFYLTAKTITRTVAQEGFAILRGHGLHFSTVTLTAKEKMCVMGKPECNPDNCLCAAGHFDRINDAVFSLVRREEEITREVILQAAEEFNVCPFEMSLDVSNWVDGIICDYNYVFDPHVQLKRYFSEGSSGDYIFLVDEAHNLVDRGRNMYSAVLYKEDFLAAAKKVKPYQEKLYRKISACNHALLQMKRECEGYQVVEQVDHLAVKLMGVMGEMENLFEDMPSFSIDEELKDFYFHIRHFLNMYDLLDENYRIYTEQISGNSFMVKLFCINPSVNLGHCLDKGMSTIFFSATLLPMQYYWELLSGNTEDYKVYVDSPFDREKRLLCVAEDVSSRYRRRGKEEYKRILRYLRMAAEKKPGNYMVFFPSYQYMRDTYELANQILPSGITVIMQKSGMTEGEREEFLEQFHRRQNTSLAAFCVIGGMFSEGIDLKGERLIGALIVGTGLPLVCNEREILQRYFDELNRDGFAHAYLYPGMNKVLQAAGRVIRTEEDEGVILLMDDRFLRRESKSLFPREWENYQVVSERNAGSAIEAFWKKGMEVLTRQEEEATFFPFLKNEEILQQPEEAEWSD